MTKILKTETTEEFLKRGGKITVLPAPVNESQIPQMVGYSRRYNGIPSKDDRDGLSPNLKWVDHKRRWW